MERVLIERRLASAPALLFPYLADHEHAAALFGSKVVSVHGSTLEMRAAPLLPTFDETITELVPDELIRYRITRGSPLRDHEGVMRFTPDGSGTFLRYEITFRGAFPGIGKIVAAMLRRNIARGLVAADSAALQGRVEPGPAG
jgi:uncharacterized protein YndB with AHSA1/START domain